MENNFEEHIKDAMDNPPDFPFNERLWKDMESQLDNDGEKKPFLGFIGRLPLLLLSLIAAGLAGFFYMKQYNAMEKIAAIEQQLQTQTQITTDDAVEKRVTIIYDTIYNKVVINQISQYNQDRLPQSTQKQVRRHPTNQHRVLPFPDFSRFSLDLDLDKYAISNNPYSSNISLLNYGLNKTYIKKEGKAFVENPDLGQAENSPSISGMEMASPTIPFIGYTLLNIEKQVALPAITLLESKHKKQLAFYLHKLRPTRFALSGTTGTFVSLNLGGNGFNLRGSAHAEIGIGKRFNWILGVEYFSNDFNNNIEPDETEPLRGFPDLPPNNAEDILQRIQGDFDYFQIPVGFKYIVFPQRHLFPYVSAGLIASGTKKSRLEYDYLSSSSVEYSISQGNLLPRNLELNAFWSTIGFEVELNRYWSFLLEGSSQIALKKGTYDYEKLQLIKLSTGFKYEF
ncbi:MAG: hypothetical protein ACI8X3_000238 [Saprospiraceae bacterium]|jgi:hypothetical protein